MRELLRRLEESRGSVQTGEPYLTYTTTGKKIDYTVWAWVHPYFGAVPANDAIYIHTRGLASDDLEELVDRQRTLYGTRGGLMGFDGKEKEFPYGKGYAGPTIDDIKKLRGKTVQLSNGKEAPILEAARGKKKDPVSDLFYKYFDGIQIPIMEISKVYKDIAQAMADAERGADLDAAMQALVQKWGR